MKISFVEFSFCETYLLNFNHFKSNRFCNFVTEKIYTSPSKFLSFDLSIQIIFISSLKFLSLTGLKISRNQEFVLAWTYRRTKRRIRNKNFVYLFHPENNLHSKFQLSTSYRGCISKIIQYHYLCSSVTILYVRFTMKPCFQYSLLFDKPKKKY